MEERKQPGLRFKGFNDPWEQRKLGCIFKKNTIKNKDLEFHSKDIISVAQMKQATNIRDSSDSYMTTYNKIRIGDVAFEGHANTIFPNGRFVLNDYKEGIVSHIYDVYSPIDDYDNNFMKEYIRNPYIMRNILINATSNARMMNSLNSVAFLKQYFLLPNIQEQQKIGSFFKSLDNLITLHQRQLNNLQKMKKSYLQKMFPKNGENYPEFRFKGFTDPWEQRKFEDCFTFPVSSNSLSRSLLNYEVGEVKNIHYGDILIKYGSILNVKKDLIPYITDSSSSSYESNLLKNGDLIFADAAEDETVGKAVEINNITNEKIVSGLHTIVARSTREMAEYFIGYYINSYNYHRQLLRLMQGTKVSAISKGNLKETNISIPKNTKEQQKIGSFFKSLDDTITLHQRKLDLLKEMKKSLLKQMFV